MACNCSKMPAPNFIKGVRPIDAVGFMSVDWGSLAGNVLSEALQTGVKFGVQYGFSELLGNDDTRPKQTYNPNQANVVPVQTVTTPVVPANVVMPATVAGQTNQIVSGIDNNTLVIGGVGLIVVIALLLKK